MPNLPTNTQKNESVLLLSTGTGLSQDNEALYPAGGKWEDEEERRFHEDVQDLKDFVPKSVLGLDGTDKDKDKDKEQDASAKQKKEAQERAEIQKLEKEIEGLKLNGVSKQANGDVVTAEDEEDEWVLFYIVFIT